MQENFQTNDTSTKPIFTTVNVTDPRIANISDSVVFPVKSGANSITAYKAPASGASSSGLSFNVILPSMQTVLAPVMIMESIITFNIQGNQVAGSPLFNQGVDSSFSDFPLNECFNVQTTTMNSSAVTFEAGETLPLLKTMLSEKELQKYVGLCATGRDVLKEYTDASGTIYDPIIDLAGHTVEKYCRGRYPYAVSWATNANPNGTNNTTATYATISVKFLEPVLNPLFSLSNENSQGGFTGLTTFRFNTTFKQASAIKAIRSSVVDFSITSISAEQSSTFLHLFYLSPQISQKVPRRNIHNFLDIVRSVKTVPLSTIVSGTTNLSSFQIDLTPQQLGYMPSKIVIGVRIPVANQTSNTTDHWLPISGVNLTLANRSGLLNNASQAQLYNMSVENGLNSVDYANFTGGMLKGGLVKATCSSPIILDVSKDLNIDPEYAPSSMGAFNFYGQITVSPKVLVNAGNPQYSSTTGYEVVVLCLGNALMVTELGSSSVFTSLLSKEQVLKSAEQPYGKSKKMTVFGGNWLSKFRNGKEDGAGHASGHASGRASGLASGHKMSSKLSSYLK